MKRAALKVQIPGAYDEAEISLTCSQLRRDMKLLALSAARKEPQ
jgi:hypothetical protein